MGERPVGVRHGPRQQLASVDLDFPHAGRPTVRSLVLILFRPRTDEQTNARDASVRLAVAGYLAVQSHSTCNFQPATFNHRRPAPGKSPIPWPGCGVERDHLSGPTSGAFGFEH